MLGRKVTISAERGRPIGEATLVGMAAMGMYTPWTWLGVVPLLTGLVGWCPPYALLGFNTCKTG